MKILNTNFEDLLVIEPDLIMDERGFFSESFKKNILENKNINFDIVQENMVFSKIMVLRGLHYQNEPFSQAKLVSVSSGSIIDVVVDLRKNSRTYGKHFKIKLSAENKKILFVPKGFAHGYLTTIDETIVNYKVDNYYSLEHERGISFNDEVLKIDWEYDHNDLIISEKDKNFEEFNW